MVKAPSSHLLVLLAAQDGEDVLLELGDPLRAPGDLEEGGLVLRPAGVPGRLGLLLEIIGELLQGFNRKHKISFHFLNGNFMKCSPGP